jgi:hypothetical protein
MASYIPSKEQPPKHGGEHKARKHLEDGAFKLADVIENIENTGADSTLYALQGYPEGVPPELVHKMLVAIRTDLILVKHELAEALRCYNGK